MSSCRHALRAAFARLGVALSRIAPHSARRTLLSLGAAVALAAGVLTAVPSTASAAGSLPCDIYASYGTPCVAAHSTVRALYSSYNGSLYQVRRASDGATLNIGVSPPADTRTLMRRTCSAPTPSATSPRSTISPATQQPDHRGRRRRESANADVAADGNALHVVINGWQGLRRVRGPGRRLPRQQHQRIRHRRRRSGRVHGGQRHARQQRLLLRLRQRRDQQPTTPATATWKR
jgi:hypothetical protein